MTNQKEKNKNIENYNKSVNFHAKKFNEIGAKTEEIKKTFSFITKINPKTIEIGCGNGRDAKEVIKLTNDYLGIDLSENMINLAKQNVSKTIFKLADLETFDFPNGLDIVFSFASLLHSDKESVHNTLIKITKSLNNKGVIFMSLKYGPYHKEILDKEGTGPRTYYFYTPEEIQKIAPPNLKIVYQEIQNFRNQKWFNIILQK